MSEKTDDIVAYISSALERSIFTRTKANCPECGEPNFKGGRLMMKDVPNKKPTYLRKCSNCNNEWETRR